MADYLKAGKGILGALTQARQMADAGKSAVKLGDKVLPVTMHPIEAREGNVLANVNPQAFDKAFKKTEWQYVGPQGQGGIGDRYNKFGEFAQTAPSMNASNVSVDKIGRITFGDGRHRYAYLRDQGVDSIPMSMDKESLANAKMHGLLNDGVEGTQVALPAAERDANLAKMLEPSAVKKVMYHGSSNPNIAQFKTAKMSKEESHPGNTIDPWSADNRDAVFLTPDPQFSGKYSGDQWDVDMGRSPTTYPVYVQAKNPWDYENPKHIEDAIKGYKEKFPLQKNNGMVSSDESMRHYSFEDILRRLPTRQGNNWSAIENAELQDILKGLGYDSFYVKEAGVKNLGVYDPTKIKSATGNRGTYDLTDPDITKAKGGVLHMADAGKVVRGIKGALTAASEAVKAEKAAKAERMAALAESERSLPLVLARAPAKSQAEINAAAERVGRQMLGEHVQSGKAGDTRNLAGRSMKENQRVKGLQYELTPTKDLPPSQVVEPKVGDINVAFPGDYTLSDTILKSLNGEDIGAKLEGGSRYGLGKTDMENPLFWASGEGPAQQAQDKITDVASLYNPDRVMAQHLAMGPVATNFAQHFADANLRAIDYSKLSKKDMDTFDRAIAGGYDKTNKKTGETKSITFPNWPGIADPEAAYAAMKADPELRKWFNARMKTPELTQATNMPNGLDVQWAITSPDLRNMEVNLTGHSVGEVVPGAALTDTAQHNTYDKGIRGLYKGNQDVLSPFTISYPDAAQHIASTQRPQDFTGTIQKVFPHQIVDQQYIDELGQYSERLKRMLEGKKQGGAVADWHSAVEKHMKDGGYTFVEPKRMDEGGSSGEPKQGAAFGIYPKPKGGKALREAGEDAGDFLNALGKLTKDQGSKEVESLNKPRATMDIANRGILAPALGMPADLANMALTPLDYLGSKLTGRDIRVSSDKPFLGQEYIKDLMDKYNVTSGEDRPMMETALSLFSPTGMIKGTMSAPKAAQRAGNAVKSLVGAKKARGGLTLMR